MVTNWFKLLLVLACTLGLMVGCATTSEEDMEEETTTTEETTTGVADDRDLDTSAQEEEPEPDLDTTFHFDFDSSVLKPEARAALTAHAEQLKDNSESVRLEGHADERGTREYNMALGERRAKAVADYLVLQGVSRSRIETVSYGEERPARMGSNEAAWAMNRRVELK